MTINSNKQIETRKKEGIDLALQNIQAKNVSTLFECVHLIHNALPELNLSDIDTSTKFLGQSLTAPSNDEPQIIKRHPSDLDSKISNQNKAYEEANAFLNTKINEGFWNDEDRDQFRTTFDVLHPEDRKKLLNKLILAINSGGLKLLVGPDMPFY